MSALLLGRHDARFWTSRSMAVVAIAALHGSALALALWQRYQVVNPPVARIYASLATPQPNDVPAPPELAPQLLRPMVDLQPLPVQVAAVEPDLRVVEASTPPAQIAEAAVVAPVPAPVAAVRTVEHEPLQVTSVQYLRAPVPQYPLQAKRLRQQGVVQLRVLVGTDGHAREIAVARSSGHSMLDEAARRCVATALFKPYMEDGHPRAVTVIVPIEFTLA